jgi:hypothetical protein
MRLLTKLSNPGAHLLPCLVIPYVGFSRTLELIHGMIVIHTDKRRQGHIRAHEVVMENLLALKAIGRSNTAQEHFD